MATASGTTDLDLAALDAVEETLREEPYLFEFFQAVRLLEKFRPGSEPVGHFAPPEREVARFGVHNSLAFPASQIQSIDWPEDQRPQLRVNFMGLTGPVGALPRPYTELLTERARARDHSAAAFFDLFNHRLISFFYRAWEKYRFLVQYERDREGGFSRILASLIGIGTPGLQSRQSVPDQSLLFYVGLLAPHSRPAVALRDLLIDYFQVPVEIEQFVGAWCRLERGDQCSFGDAESLSQQCGLGAVVGDEVWDQQSRVRIRIGPLGMEDYAKFLPTGSAYPGLRAITRFYAGDQMEFEVQLVLRREEVPRCDLTADEESGLQLGWVTWMKSGPDFNRDPDDTIILLT